MAGYHSGIIHGITPQQSTAALLARGVSAKELLVAGAWRSPRMGCRRARYAAARAQPLSASSSSSNAPSPSPPRPPPILERAGDLTDRLLKDYLSGWTSQYTEYDYYVPAEAIDGTVPEDIRGTLFLIGPGLTEAYGTSVRHPSDGDGMVCSLAFGDGGQIFFRNRYVRTTSFVAEQAVSRRLTRGFHDRGAALVTGGQQQQRQQQQQQQPTAADQQRTQPPQKQKQRLGGPSGGRVSGPGGSKAGEKVPLDGRAAAERTGFEDDAEDDYDARRRASAAAAAAAGAAGPPSSPIAALAAAAAAAAAAGGAVPKQLRLDPLALLGLPPVPPLSALFNPLDLSFRAPANASVLHWGGRLLAFTEGGSLPYELNKLSLETVGLYDVAGAMADIGRLVGGYKIAPAPLSSSHVPGLAGPGSGGSSPQRLVLMGAAQSGPDALLRWVEVGEDGAAAGPATTYRMSGALAQGLTDFWVTDRYYVVVQAPLDFNPQRFATEATLGVASFAECFDWDAGRPSRVLLVPRPLPQPPAAARVPAHSPTASSAAAAANSGRGRIGSSAPVVWPPKGPTAIVVDAPPLLPISCVGCYSLGLRGQVLVFDAICQQGLSGTGGGTLESLDPRAHWLQPKPELTRLVVDLHSRTATARVLSQRAASAATTAAAATAAAGSAAAAAASASGGGPAWLAPVGHGASFVGGYHYLYASASATETAEGWAPSQVLLKLAVPPEHGVTAEDAAGGSRSRVARRRGVGAEVWSPGDRAFVGPPVFVPRRPRDAGTGGQADGAALTEEMAEAIPASRQNGGGASPLPPLESEVEAAARRAGAAAAARRLQDEQEGWLLVMVHDAEAMVAELCVLDARDVTRGPVAVISLPHHLPHVRHGCFTRSYCGPGLAAPPGWRPRAAATPATANPPARGAAT